MPLTEGQRNAMQGGPDRNKERAQEIMDKRKQRFESKTAPTIGPRGSLGSKPIASVEPTQHGD